MVKMVHPEGASVIQHGDKEYRPNGKGVFTIPDGIVGHLRSHGLKTVAEVIEEEDSAHQADALTALQVELEEVQRGAAAGELRISDLEKQLSASESQIADLRKDVPQLDEAKAQVIDLLAKLETANALVAELQAQLAAAAPKKGKGGEQSADPAQQQA